jgi:hypothetical protein
MKQALALVMMMGLGACGGGRNNDWVPSDIDESKTIDAIGSAGYQKLCSSFDSYVRDQYRSSRLIQAACTANALETTMNATECGEAVDACLDDLPPVVETELNSILSQAGCSAVSISQAGCMSPVSQLTSCLDALGTKVDQIMFSLTCAAFGSPVPPDWWRISPPAECSALSSSC